MKTGLERLRERYDAILIDLDGTLLDGAGRLSARSVAAVRALEAAGLTPIVCTGRSVPGTRRIHRDRASTPSSPTTDRAGGRRPLVHHRSPPSTRPT
jgi:ribonucleotide monophosphatase NagD (HAD superfamily)